MKIKPIHRATCHCGAVELALKLPDGLQGLGRCDCSLCRRRGVITVSVPVGNLRVKKGKTKLSLYQFHTNTAKHYFCSVCGIYTHHQRRLNPNEFGVNVGCLEGVNPYALGEVPVHDGVNHPCDKAPNGAVSKYMQALPNGRKERMQTLFDLILTLYPNAEVSMKYKMPTFTVGEGWVALANQKGHISLYTCGYHHIKNFKAKYPGIKTGKGCINFRDKDTVPLSDIKPVVKHAIEHPKG